MSLLDLLASVSPNEDGTPNALQRFSNAMNPEREMQKLQMQAQLMELQKQQQVQSALQSWAKNPQGGIAGLYGGLAASDPSYLGKFTELTTPKTTTIGGKIVQYNPNMPEVAPRVIYSQPTAEEQKEKRMQEKSKKSEESRTRDILKVLPKIDEAIQQTKTKGAFGLEALAPTEGLAGLLARQYPSSAAYDLDATLETIRSRLGLDEMAKLKALSPTGATGMGSQSNVEFEALRSSIANIKSGQSDEQLRKNLLEVKQNYKDLLKSLGIEESQIETTKPNKKIIRFEDLAK